MRYDRLIFILMLAAAGCSASGEPDPFDQPEETELPPIVADQLAGDRDPALTQVHGVIVIETGNTMNTVRPSTGNTRCTDAKTMANAYITNFFDPNQTNGDGIAIWGFTNITFNFDDVQPTSNGYYTDATSAQNAVNSLSCAGSNPLADALCKGVNGDGEGFTISPLPDMMFVLTDGIETSSNGALCSGPSGSITNPLTWQYQVMAEMVANGLVVDTRYWIDPDLLYNPDSIDSFAAEDDEPFDPMLEELQLVADIEELPQAKIDQLMDAHHAAGEGEAGEPADIACDVVCQELALFEEAAKVFGGSWGVVKDDDAQYPLEDTVDPVTGPVHPYDEPPPPLDGEGL
jgi:hypothetical protein